MERRSLEAPRATPQEGRDLVGGDVLGAGVREGSLMRLTYTLFSLAQVCYLDVPACCWCTVLATLV